MSRDELQLGTVGRHFEELGWSYTAEKYLEEQPSGGTVSDIAAFSSPVDESCPRLYRIHDAIVMQPGSLLLTPNGVVLRESVFYPEVSLNLSSSTAGTVPITYLPLEAVPMDSLWFQEYWHWMKEFLPRAILAEEAGFRGKYIVHGQPPSFVHPSLELLGIEPARLLTLPPGATRMDKIWLPEVLRASYELYRFPQLIATVRSRILKNVRPGPPLPKRVYISRQRARRRRLLNEHELMPVLRRFKFVTVFLEDLSFPEQVQLFRQAEAVVAVHGAALANSMFLSEEAIVVELFSPHFVHPNAPISNDLLRIRHTAIEGDPAAGPPPATPQEANQQDIRIRPEDLSRSLEQMLINRPIG